MLALAKTYGTARVQTRIACSLKSGVASVIDELYIASHDGAAVEVVVAEDGGEVLLAAGGGGDEGVHPADVARRRPLVVHRRRDVGVGVGHVGPQLDALPRGLGSPEHPLGLHEPLHRHLLLLPVDLHRLHPCKSYRSTMELTNPPRPNIYTEFIAKTR